MTSLRQAALAPDPVLPQRDALLDPDGIAALLSERLVERSGGITKCERLRAKYRVGVSLRVLYRVQVEGQELMIAARAFPYQCSRDTYGGEVQPAHSSIPLGAVFHDSRLNATFWAFPNDRKIHSLGVLTDVPQQLSALLGSAWRQSRVVAYAPEQCATAQCLNDAMEILAYAKVYADDGGWRCYLASKALQQDLCADSELLVPRVLAYFHPHNILFLQPISGRRVADLLEADLPTGMERLGAAVARLHATPVVDVLTRFKRFDQNGLWRAAEIIALARPDVADLAREVSRQLASRIPSRAPVVCLHGDLHPKNCVLSEERTALVDLDQLSTGPAAADVGSVLAGLHYDRCVGMVSLSTQRHLADAFLHGYTPIRDLPDKDSLNWHTAAALFIERALRAVNRVRPEGLRFLREILRCSQELMMWGRP